VQLGHAPIVDVLAAAHGVSEVHAPVVAIVDVAEGRGHAPFGHDRVRFAEERLADEADLHVLRGGGDRGAEAGAAGADDEYIVIYGFVFSHVEEWGRAAGGGRRPTTAGGWRLATCDRRQTVGMLIAQRDIPKV